MIRTVVVCLLSTAALYTANPIAQIKTDPIEQIKEEALNRSKAMSFLGELTDRFGGRVSGSPQMDRASEWARSRLAEIGLENAHREDWGKGVLSWRLQRFTAEMIEPQVEPLVGYPKWLSPGLPGELVGEVVAFDAKGIPDLEIYRGQLRGRIVLLNLNPPGDLKASFEGHLGRKSEAELLEIANAPTWTPQSLLPPRPNPRANAPRPAWRPSVIQQFFRDEGVSLVVETSTAPGRLFVDNWVAQEPAPMVDEPERATRAREWEDNAVPQIVVGAEQYNKLSRMARAGQHPKVRVQLSVEYGDPKTQSNVIAEIPGTDLKDQIVMLGAHLDSWHAGTGAIDNGAGVAICMEAMRILKSLNLTPRRTIRIAFWDAEEMNTRGALGYVTAHFGRIETTDTPTGPVRTLRRGPEYEKLSAYYNIDLGSGKVRGVYLEGNEQLRAIFRQWLSPFRSLGASTISSGDGGGSDHWRFDQIGLPGLLFIQDDLDYENVMHSNIDVLDRAQPDDLKQAAAVLAAFVYNTAIRDDRFPRRPITIPIQ